MKRTSPRPRALALVPAALIALSALTGCSAADQGGGVSPEGCGLPGAVSDSIRVGGDFGGDLALESGAPVHADGFQRTVAHAGEGREIDDGLTFVGHLNVYVGSSGEPYAQETTRNIMSTEALAAWYYDTLNCSRAGDRIVSTVPALDMLGPGGGESAGISDDDTMVVVVDLRAVLAPGDGRAVGAEQPLPEGFPEVVLSESGAPSIAMPAEFATPGQTLSAARIAGAGPAVDAAQTVLVQYRTFVARTGEVLDDTWESGAVSIPLDQAFPGFAESVVGRTVGSQVIIMVPSGGGYLPEELEPVGLSEDDVLVYVVDILDAG